MPAMMGGQPPMPMPGEDMFAMIKEMARGMPRETSTEKIGRALKILREVREEDSKVAPNISMAMDIITNGPETPDNGTPDENNPSSKTSRGIE